MFDIEETLAGKPTKSLRQILMFLLTKDPQELITEQEITRARLEFARRSSGDVASLNIRELHIRDGLLEAALILEKINE